MEKLSFFLNNNIGGENITFRYRYRKQIIISIITVIIFITCGLSFYFNLDTTEEQPLIADVKKEKKEIKDEKVEVKVDVKGEINAPGIYLLDTSARVIDAIDKAGGLTENADTSVINLSKKLIDEMVIIIYSKQEVKKFEETKEKEKLVQNKCNQKDENSLKNDACINNANNTTNKISINKATLEELMTLNGIGETKAKDIISYREKNGGFTNIEDLMKVTGIGENTFAQIKENITL